MFVRISIGIISSKWNFYSNQHEGSLDFVNWTEIDRKTDNNDFDFKDRNVTASFAVSKSAECRFIRLTQTGKRHCGDDCLYIVAFEFFGTLLE
jgi:hypothetical protein